MTLYFYNYPFDLQKVNMHIEVAVEYQDADHAAHPWRLLI